jgi:hypothetical protein
MDPVNTGVGWVEFDRFIKIGNCSCILTFPLPNEAAKSIRARVVWIERQSFVKIVYGAVVFPFASVEQTASSISISVVRVERDRMCNISDLSLKISYGDLAFFLPRRHLLTTLSETASMRSYFDPVPFRAFLFANQSVTASSTAWLIFMSSSSAAIFNSLISFWSMMTSICFFPSGARERSEADSFLLLVDIGDPQIRG